MEENRFFKFVWRFNGIIFMFAGVLTIGVLGYASYKMYRDTTRERNVGNIVNVAENKHIDEKWQLGRMEKIDGTPYAMIPLYSDQNYAQSYYSKSAQSTRNILFINMGNNQKRWLLDTNDWLIISSDILPEREYNEKDKLAKVILYSIVKKDTNDDKRLTSEDKSIIALSQLSGENYKEVLNDIDVLIGQQLLDNNTLIVIYQKKGIGYSATVSLADFSISNQAELPKIKNHN